VSQSKCDAHTGRQHEVRENVSERVTIGFGFTSDWMRKWRDVLSQSPGITMQKQSKVELFLTLV